MDNLDEIIKNSAVIEIHSDYKKGTIKENQHLVDVSVLLGAYSYDIGGVKKTVPVLSEVKRFDDGTSRVYLIVSSSGFDASTQNKKEAGVVVSSPKSVNNGTWSTSLIPATYSIARMIENVNTRDENILKYFPDSMLSESQKVAKERALV